MEQYYFWWPRILLVEFCCNFFLCLPVNNNYQLFICKIRVVVYLKQYKNIYKPGVPIFSDANEAVYLFTGTSSELIPHKFFQKDVQKFYAHKQFYLIWFDNLYNSELVGLPDIMKNKKLVKIGAAKEGEIYYCDGK